MRSPTLNLAAVALMLLLASGPVAADFSLKSLNVQININRDGTANVEEQLSVVITGASDRELYETTREAYSDLATWGNRTGLSEMRHHISRAKADISNVRVIPQPVYDCNSFIGTCLANVLIDYSVPAGENGSGLVNIDHYKPRTAKYSLQQDALSFDVTKSGDLVLPAGTTIAISIPQQAEKIYFSSLPQNLEDTPEDFRYDESSNLRYYLGAKRVFEWQGNTLTKFQFTYEIESPLETEVIDFFSGMQDAVTKFFMGPQGLAGAILVAVGAASVYAFNRVNR